VVVAGAMMLDRTRLPEVLPSERLLANGVARPQVRAELRRIADLRNALTVLSVWLMAAALVWFACRLGPVGFAIAFVLMVPVYVRFAILMHEAAHKLLFTNKRINDFVGTWLIAYPAWSAIGLYRRGHFAHHREEFGPDEPDIAFYGGYPCTKAALRRRLFRDAMGISGWKNLVPLVRGVTKPVSRKIACSILATQAVLWAASWVVTGRWYVWPLLWFLPWMTGWRVVNRLRSIAEHGGLGASGDRRQTTHVVKQSMLARFWIVPYNTGWHLAHHVDMGVPWRNLPAFHAELERAGYVTADLTYPSYRALWSALASTA